MGKTPPMREGGYINTDFDVDDVNDVNMAIGGKE